MVFWTFFKNIIDFKLKVFFLLVLSLCFCQKNVGQEFEWVYTIPSAMGYNDGTRYCYLYNLATTNDNEIYATGLHHGTHYFYEQDVLASNPLTTTFIVKLDENKNVLWVRQMKQGGVYNLNSIKITADGNILIAGYVSPFTTSLYFDTTPPNPNLPNILNPTHENLSSEKYYGFVLELDEEGNYINSILFDNVPIQDMDIDENEIIVVGATTDQSLFYFKYLNAYVAKLDTNLNLVWEKTYSNGSDNYSAFFSVRFDSQKNIYCQGTYRNNFVFGDDILHNPNSEFISKLLPDGSEDWVVDLYGTPIIYGAQTTGFIGNREIIVDTSDNIHFFTIYNQNHSYQFNNTAISNLPVNEYMKSVLFKIDSNKNHIWNIPIHGARDQLIVSLDINNLGELMTVALSSSQDLNYADSVIIEAGVEKNFLLKTNQNGDLISFKRLDVDFLRDIKIDTNNNILLGGWINSPTDFDPHPFNQYMANPSKYSIGDGEWSFESVGYVLKLFNCDVEPLFLENYDFCSSEVNPTIGDVVPNDFNINWYSSATSQTPLADNFPVTDGAIYYMEKTSDNCPVLVRQPVQMNILPSLPSPVLENVQPCYFQGMKLSDLNISGENLLFYSSLSGDSAIEESTVILTHLTYYVTQTINDCESERLTINISNLNLLTSSHTAFVCDNGSDAIENVNLSDYASDFVSSLNGFSVSYYLSYDDAFNGLNSISNYHNYPIENNQTIYLRFYGEQIGCFEIVELAINLSFPPEIVEIRIDDLANNNSITVLPYNENYLYSLNGITYQSSNYFDNLQGGEHFVYVKDKEESCQPIVDSVFLLSYPKFFTPNGDGINDYWRIQFSQYQELLNVEIYDRYGKLLAFFDKDSQGWDGTLNGQTVPATDYWFKITRISDRKIIYRGHFSLVR